MEGPKKENGSWKNGSTVGDSLSITYVLYNCFGYLALAKEILCVKLLHFPMLDVSVETISLWLHAGTYCMNP
jgi:hypothetical protein